MKTNIYISLKVLATIISAFVLTQNLKAQNLNLNALDESKKLATEYEAISSQADAIRANAAKLSGNGKDLLIEEAGAMEKQALQKKTQSLALSYNYYKKQSSDRSAEIDKFQAGIASNKNKMHTTFLLDESVKNARQAELLYQEGITVESPSYAVGILESAEEKMVLAVKQQDEALVLLKENKGKKIVSRK